MSIRIRNMRNGHPSQPWDIRCDRRSVLGNPFPMHTMGSRQSVCDKYDARFQLALDPLWYMAKETYDLTPAKVMAIRDELTRILAIYNKYGRLNLFCWCVPLRCHTETIKQHLGKMT